MKKPIIKIILLVSLMIPIAFGYSQTGFTKVYYNGGMQSSAIIKTFDENYLITGYNYGDKNYLIKIDTLGNVIWSKQMESVYSDYHVGILPLKDSTYFMVTSNYSSEKGYSHLLCIVFTNNGDTLWTKSYDFGDTFLPYSASQTFDNGFMIAGILKFADYNQYKIAVIKLDSTGSHSWTKTFSGGNHTNYGYSIKETPDSNYILTGFVEDSDPFRSSAFLTKLTANGNILWTKTYQVDSSDLCIGYDVSILLDGYLIASTKSHELVIIKTDFSGNVNWAKQYDIYSFNPLNSPAVRIRNLSNNNFAVLAPDYLLKIDEAGDVIWATGMMMYVSDVYEAQDNGFIVIGNGPVFGVKFPVPYYEHIGLIKIDSLGNNDADCVWPDEWINYENKTIVTQNIVFDTSYAIANTAQTNIQVADINLTIEDECVTFIGSLNENLSGSNIQIFPNPSSGVFVIQTENSEIIIELNIFNSLGATVYQSANNSKTVNVDLSSVPPGIYQIMIDTQDKTYTRKILIY